MTDPGGGYGWRSGAHLPRRRGGVFGWGRTAEEIQELFGEERALCLLLLPAPLEEFELRERAEDLLTAPGVAAVDPPRLSYLGAARLGEAFADAVTTVQARRMRLPGTPRALVVFDPLQYPLARALVNVYPDAEIWYGPAGEPEGEPVTTLHALALIGGEPDYGLVEGLAGPLTGFTALEESDPPAEGRGTWLAALGVETAPAEDDESAIPEDLPGPARAALAATQIGKGLFIRVGLPEWSSRLDERPISQVTRNIADLLRGIEPKIRSAP